MNNNTSYLFDLVPPESKKPQEDNSWLTKRPFVEKDQTLKEDAKHFIAGDKLAGAINTAIALGKPLLLTGEPGTGKTQAAFYAAWVLNVNCFHFQVKSDSTAQDLLYSFDMVKYFHDSHLHSILYQQKHNNNIELNEETIKNEKLKKEKYLEKRPFWKSIDIAQKEEVPQILLIDEIDKAPRDFPNDLLHELDQMEFMILETDDKISAPQNLRPIVFITSNSERRLPEPFLRRCVYHNIVLNEKIVKNAVLSRRNEFDNLSNTFIELALKRFLSIRGKDLRKLPATSELLAWLRALSLNVDKHHEKLDEDLSKLPYLSILLKDRQDISEL